MLNDRKVMLTLGCSTNRSTATYIPAVSASQIVPRAGPAHRFRAERHKLEW